MLSVFKDERIMFRIESMFYDSFVTAKGPYKFNIDTPSYDLDVYYNPDEKKFIFSESIDFNFTDISFCLIPQCFAEALPFPGRASWIL